MKTAIQDVLDLVQKRLNEFDGLNGFEVTMMTQELNWFKNILTDNIEKEKMQLIDFFLRGYSIGESNFNPKVEADNYYNQMYNKKKARVFGNANDSKFWSDKPNKNK
jgi:hypothetical protein